MTIETEFNVGDTVYYFKNNEIIEDDIKKIEITVQSNDEDDWYAEYYFWEDPQVGVTHKNLDINEIFATKRELVESLLEE